jgi:hypothetical protein
VREVDVAPRSVAAVRVEVPVGRVPEYFGKALDQVYAVGRTGALVLDGQNIFIYHPKSPGLLTVDFAVGTAAPFEPIGAVQWRQTPAGRVVTTTHVGDYGGLRAAHAAVQQWCRDRNCTLAGPSWEVYGHWDPDPAKLRTEIYCLLRASA